MEWKGPSGPHRSVSEVSGRKPSSAGAGEAQRSRMPHRGCRRKATGGGQTGFLEEILKSETVLKFFKTVSQYDGLRS